VNIQQLVLPYHIGTAGHFAIRKRSGEQPICDRTPSSATAKRRFKIHKYDGSPKSRSTVAVEGVERRRHQFGKVRAKEKPSPLAAQDRDRRATISKYHETPISDI
jgi:hypothetical protein